MEFSKTIKNKYSQNFLKSEKLVASLIQDNTSIGKNDEVIDIGLGRGIISIELAKVAKKIYAFEIDLKLVDEFKAKYELANVKVISSDFLKFDLSKLGKVKVFANIPFFLTADIVRKVFLENDNVIDGYLFMEKQAAWRFISQAQGKNSVLAVLLNTFYAVRIEKFLRPTDFHPAPDADVVLVSFTHRKNSIEFRSLYYDFVSYIFNLRKSNIKLAMLRVFSYEQTKRLAKSLAINLADKVSSLSAKQWIQLYEFFLTMPNEKHIPVVGEFAKLMRHQQKLNKSIKIVQ